MEWNPKGKYQQYLDAITDVLSSGESRTVRDVYYALEARGFPDTLRAEWERQYGGLPPEEQPDPWEFEYRYVKRAVKKGRRAGYIDPEQIYDASRVAETEMDSGHGDPESFIDTHVDGVEAAYEENFWDDQKHHVEVWLEKQSLASVFAPICNDHNVRLEATRGDWSDSKVYEASKRLMERMDEGDDVRILYFGDFNPSGLHAPCAIQATMEHYGFAFPFRGDGNTDSRYFDIWPWGGPMEYQSTPGSLKFERVALNLEHIEKYDLPENPTPSSTDKDRQLRDRFMEHASDGRDTNIELNALKEYHRDDLEDMLEDAILQYVDEDQREATEDRIEERQDAIGNAISVDYSEIEDV